VNEAGLRGLQGLQARTPRHLMSWPVLTAESHSVLEILGKFTIRPASALVAAGSRVVASNQNDSAPQVSSSVSSSLAPSWWSAACCLHGSHVTGRQTDRQTLLE
jgi:hypothetical protein